MKQTDEQVRTLLREGLRLYYKNFADTSTVRDVDTLLKYLDQPGSFDLGYDPTETAQMLALLESLKSGGLVKPEQAA